MGDARDPRRRTACEAAGQAERTLIIPAGSSEGDARRPRRGRPGAKQHASGGNDTHHSLR